MIVSSIDAPNANAFEIRILKPFQELLDSFISPETKYFLCNVALKSNTVRAHLRINSQDYLISTDIQSGQHQLSLKEALEIDNYSQGKKLVLTMVMPNTFKVVNEPLEDPLDSLDKTLIEKSGQDNGWEKSEDFKREFILLSSARHSGQVLIQKKNDQTWLLTWQSIPLSQKMKDEFPQYVEGEQARNISDSYLSRFLRRLAELSIEESSEITVDEQFIERKTIEILRDNTEIEYLVKQRVGQEAYRKALIEYWGASCAVTGFNLTELLRASHAKPWASCENNQERLDVFNGFLLISQLDLLFDKGYISFDDEGDILISSLLDENQKQVLGIYSEMKLRRINDKHKRYLNYHRKNIYKTI